jgi:hypothetical protein
MSASGARGLLRLAGFWPAGVAGGILTWGCRMKTIAALFNDESGTSSTRLAFMIGLSASAVLVLVRIGVAIAGQ